MKIFVTNIYVDDQKKALQFYTEKLGFLKKQDVPLGQHSWLTVVSKDDPNGVELLLEPNEHAAVTPYQRALREDGLPALSLSVINIDDEYLRLKARGVSFQQAKRSW